MGRAGMKVSPDTNVLVRAVVQDDAGQAKVAAELLRQAELVAVPLACLCEFVWVLRRVYGFRWRPGWRCSRRAVSSPMG